MGKKKAFFAKALYGMLITNESKLNTGTKLRVVFLLLQKMRGQLRYDRCFRQ